MEEDFATNPPDQLAVARRTLCLGSVAALGAAAFNLTSGAPAEQVVPWADDVRDWAIREGLVPSLSGVEVVLFEKPLREWSERDVIDTGWRQESIGVLLWALSFYEALPPYDRQFENVPESLPLLDATSAFYGDARLRPFPEIEHARDLAELWHWRSRTTQLQERPDFREQHGDVDLDAIVRRAALYAYEQRDIPPPIEDDFPAFGKAYRDLAQTERSDASSIAMERHYVLNWLCGYADDWGDVPTDT